MIKEIKFTDNAIKHINEILSKKDNGIYFRIAIKGGGCSGFQYDFSFDKQPSDDDLVHNNILIDKIFSSVLQRANKTAEIAIKASQIENLFKNGTLIYEKDQRLNERDYGDLVGLNKAETADKFGKEQVHIWRRSYDTPPPNGESLKDVVDRVSPYFTETIQPHILNKKNVLIAAHGNSLRAIIKVLDKLSDTEIISVNIPTGVPLVYTLDDSDLTVLHKEYLINDDKLKEKQDLVANQGKAKWSLISQKLKY